MTMPVGPMGWTMEATRELGRALGVEYRLVVRDPDGVAVHCAYVHTLAAAAAVARHVVASRGAL